MISNSYSSPHTSTRLQTVYVVNPDPIGNSITRRILASIDVKCVEFQSPSEVLNALPLSNPSCLLINFVLPELSGLGLMQKLRQKGCYKPCILSATRVDPDLVIDAMNQGAFATLKRPFTDLKLIDIVQAALRFDLLNEPWISGALEYQKSRTNLSNHEKVVLSHLEEGMSAREVSERLKLSRRTIENHRMRIFRKLDINNSSHLIQQVTALKVLMAQGVIGQAR
ncbi:MAG: LuxR C-terminal-related transcriptional regulator [Sedimenticola sp.]|nr:LuxR C-terminal-related transcriptional regulator [Sedimenticola sp.]